MRRHPSSRTLMLLHDGELDPSRAETVSAHAASCERCGRWLTKLASLGAVVRGDVVPALGIRPARGRRPVPSTPRVAPALAAAAAVATVALGLVVAGEPASNERVAAGGGGVEPVELPAVPAPTGDTGAGAPAAGSASQTPGAPPDSPIQATPPTAPRAGVTGAVPEPDPEPITLGVLVPGGQTGPGERVVRAVAVALAEANADGGVGGARLELLVGDATDPGAPAALAEGGARALVGGYGLSPQGWQVAIASGLAWFGPADVPPSAGPAIVAVEVSHVEAGTMLGEELAAQGVRRAAAVVGKDPERRLAEGLSGPLHVSNVQFDAGGSCGPALEAARFSGAEVLALALEPASVTRCLEALPPDYPVRQVVVGATAVDDALAALPEGFGLAATLGAPGPDDPGPGARRFRAATGVERNYRALVSYAATEVVVAALRADAEDPRAGFAAGGVFRSDLLTLNPSSSPANVAVQVVELVAAPDPGGQPPAGSSTVR